MPRKSEKPVDPTHCGCGVPLDAETHVDKGPGFTHSSKPEGPQEGPYSFYKREGLWMVEGPGYHRVYVRGTGSKDEAYNQAKELNDAHAKGYLAGQAAIREKGEK